MYLKYVQYPVPGSEEMTAFGDDIVRESIRLVKPKLLKRVDIISWYSVDASRHLVCWAPGPLEKWLLKHTPIQYRIRTASITINHTTGQLKFKGFYGGRSNNISLNACVCLANPDSFILIGKMIIRCIMGKGDISVV